MTRRTPRPGDSYSKGNVTWRIVSVSGGSVVVQAGWGTVPMRLDMFHQAIQLATWGRVDG